MPRRGGINARLAYDFFRFLKRPLEGLRADPEYAVAYLNAILEDGDQQELLMALRRVAKAFGGIPKLAGKAELNVTALYKTLSPQGNPELKGLTALLKAMGMRLAVAPLS